MSDAKIELTVSEGDPDVAYLTLPKYTGGHGSVSRTVSVRGLMDEYKGPDLYLDFDHDGYLVGVEILA